MSIASAITAAQGRVADAYTAVNTMGGTLPATQNLSNLPAAIESIPAGSGGDTVTATNATGSAITAGDKVWIDKNTVAGGRSITPSSSGYSMNYIAGISNDGNYLTYSTNNTSAEYKGLWYINDFATSTITSVGSSLIYYHQNSSCYRYSNQGDTFLVSNFVTNSSYEPKFSKIGNNSFDIGSSTSFLGYDFVASVYDTNTLGIMNLETGSISYLSGFGTGTQGIGYQSIATSSNDVYKLASDSYLGRYHIEVDRTNMTFTSTALTVSNVSCFCPIGATSDGKVIITSNMYNYYDGNGARTFQFIKVSGNTVTGYNIGEYPERLKTIVNNTTDKYWFCFNPNNNVLTFVKYVGSSTTSVYGFFKYDPATETWSEIYVDLSSVLSGQKVCGVITTSGDMTRIGVPVTVTNGTYYSYLKIVQLQSVSGYRFVPYTYYNINEKTLTGFASENIAVGASGEATTVLPPELNVSIQADVDDAEITLE